MEDEKERSRLSILKPHKRRNPLGDIDVRVEEEDFPSTKARRVSFASSNQIKKFSTDEEKNTIWDSTYEECIEGSDNSPFSPYVPHSSKSTIVGEENVEITMNTVPSGIDNDELDFTLPVSSDTFKVNAEQFVIKVDGTMEFTRRVSTNIDVVKKRNTDKTIIYCDGDEMEFTSCADVNLHDKTIAAEDMSIDEIEMSFTQPVLQNIQQNTRNVDNVSCDKSMEFTAAINNLQFDILTNNDGKELNGGNINGTQTNITATEMEFTTAINNILVATVKNKGTNEDTHINISTTDMEFTTAINNIQIGALQSNNDVQTKQQSAKTINNKDLKRINTNLTDRCLSDTNMEFTIAINNILVSTVEKNDNNGLENKALKNRKINDTQINISDADMEFTTAINNAQISALQSYSDVQTNQQRAKTINDEDLKSRNNQLTDGSISNIDMEFTTEIDRQETNKNNSNADMELTRAIHNPLVDSETKNNSDVDQQQNKRIGKKDLRDKNTSKNISCVDMELDITADDKLNILQKTNDENVNQQLRNTEVENKNTSSTGRNISSPNMEQSNDVDVTLKHSANDKHCEISIDDNSEHMAKSKHSNIASSGPLSNDPSLTSMIQLALGNITPNDDTQHLINYQLNEKNQTKSELSRVAAGDLIPSFSKLRHMPLGDCSSSSFHVSLNDVLGSAGSKTNIPSTPNMATNDLTLESIQIDQIERESTRERTVMDVVEITDDTNRIYDLCDTQPPEELLEITNSINISGDLQENPQNTTISTNTDDTTFKKQPIATSNDQISLPKCYDLPRKKTFETMINSNSLKDLCNKFNDLIATKVEDCLKLCDDLKNPITTMDSNNSSIENSDIHRVSSEQSSPNCNEFLCDDSDSEKSIDLKLKDLEESNKKYWQLLSIDNLTYKFAALFRTIFLTVKLEENSDKVESFEVEKKIGDGAEPEALYVHKIFCDRLSPKCIKAALGVKYDVRSLLDFIKETMHKLLEFLKEYDQLFNTYGLMMNKNFRLEFSVIKTNLMFAWKFTINVLELNCISNKTVEYYAKIGSINDREIKQCIENCPTGTSFIRAFVENIYNLVNRMENDHKH